DHFVKIPDIKFFTQFFFCFFSQLPDLYFSYFIRNRLAWPGNIAVNLGIYFVKGKRSVGSKIFYRLLAGPAQSVYSGIYHKSARPPLLISELSKHFVRSCVYSHFFRQEFCIQAPSLSKGRKVKTLAKGRDAIPQLA